MSIELLKKLAEEVEKDESKSKPKGSKSEAKEKPGSKDDKQKSDKPDFDKKGPPVDEQGDDGENQAEGGSEEEGGTPATEGKKAVVAETGESEAPDEQAAAAPIFDPSVIFDFFEQYPASDFDDYAGFAESQGIDVHQAATIACALAGKYVAFLRGGKSQGLDPNSVDPDQLSAGMQVESEHTPDQATQKKIALDHLAEMPDYYSKLEQMESPDYNQPAQGDNAQSQQQKDDRERGYVSNSQNESNWENKGQKVDTGGVAPLPSQS